MKYIVASETKILAVQRNHSTSLHSVNDLNWKCRVWRNGTRVTHDVVHATVRQFQLKRWHFLERGCIHRALEVDKLNHCVYLIRRIRFNDLVSDSQFGVGPSNVKLMLEYMVIACRQCCVYFIAFNVKCVWSGTSEKRTWHFDSCWVWLIIGIKVNVTNVSEVCWTPERYFETKQCKRKDLRCLKLYLKVSR